MNIRSTAQAAVLTAALAVAVPSAMAESSNSTTFDGRANDMAAQDNGRIAQDLYLDESVNPGTRPDTLNRDNRAQTPADISQMTGKVDSSTSGVPRSGSGVQPGNMGPANSKGQ